MREALEVHAAMLENVKQEKIEYELEYDTPF
jgi:hypothetical protein